MSKRFRIQYGEKIKLAALGNLVINLLEKM